MDDRDVYRGVLWPHAILTASDLKRLRKIEAAARLIDDWLHDNPATESRISMVGRILLTDLRKALETETDD
jgi:hypothetical protein